MSSEGCWHFYSYAVKPILTSSKGHMNVKVMLAEVATEVEIIWSVKRTQDKLSSLIILVTTAINLRKHSFD